MLTGDVGTWSGSPSTFAYQWTRCSAAGAACTPIGGATGSTYTLTPGDIGATLTLTVTATGVGGAASATVGPTQPVAAAPVPAPVVGSLTATADTAGAVQADDGRATLTWQPGAVPAGLTPILAPFTGTLSIPGTEIALGVAACPRAGSRGRSTSHTPRPSPRAPCSATRPTRRSTPR